MNWATPWNNNSTISSLPPPNRHYLGYPSAFNSNGTSHFVSGTTPMQRSKLTTTVWEDEGTICYQVDAKSICVARRQDNDMINGTKLLNVVGMSRGKRDGILKNEKGRVVVKVGAMHLKGVWITFSRAKDLATKFKIVDILYPLFVEDPSVFLATS
ncbi:transcription regulator HTH, apses-type DNA-binding domain-containing protein, partial [Cokeromyces recurvatus]|uniref:transcription regulator HTH, apses-type DNA-binding domain-containing protein n=1 Tax=Cokeromyces recurvatus TaxID=90255 RepID=UPI00221F8FA4